MVLSSSTADILLAVGSLIGLGVKMYALNDSQTVWSRRSSGFNVATYPFTAILPFYALELWFTFSVSFLNFLVWIGIYVFRAPDEENWLGRTT